jgi:hypothetical protein
VVIDALKPAMLERAIAVGRAPALAQVMERGVYVDDCVAVFPSVTPVCAATITTGVGPDQHRIPSMNWYHREEARYVEYGSSFSASRQFGVLRSLTDTVYRMNAEHLSPHVNTVFETLDDAGLRTVRQPQDRLPRAAGDAGDPRSAHRLRRRLSGRERPVRLPSVLTA